MKIVSNNVGFFGITTDYDKLIVPYNYIEIIDLDWNYYKLMSYYYTLNIKIINENYKIINYDNVFRFKNKNYTYVRKSGCYGVIYKDGTELISCSYKNINNISVDLIENLINIHERNLKINLIV